jgi:hypothetical protein
MANVWLIYSYSVCFEDFHNHGGTPNSWMVYFIENQSY